MIVDGGRFGYVIDKAYEVEIKGRRIRKLIINNPAWVTINSLLKLS